MATTETITVLRVDGKPAVTSLRELKAAIEADKDALVQLGLVEDSDTEKKEKQAAITKQLEQDIKLLNQVQNAAKVTTVENAKAIDTASASYYDMQKALTTLKKAWKEMTAEERASAEGGEILQKIKALDAELKTLDSDIGQFQRNVGNYGQSFKQSLDEAQKGAMGLTQGLSSVNGIMALTGDSSNSLAKALAVVAVVAGLLNSSKGIVGYIKNLRETAAAEKADTAEAKGHAAAMEEDAAATQGATIATKAFGRVLATLGIGAIIIGVGELIAHFGDLAKAVGLVDEDAEKAFADMQKQLEETERAINRTTKLMEASGEDRFSVLTKEIQGLKDLSHQWYETYSAAYDYYNDLTLVEQWASDYSDEKINDMYEKSQEYWKQMKDKMVDVEAGLVQLIHTNDKARRQEGMTEFEKSLDNIVEKGRAADVALKALLETGQITAEQFNTYSAQALESLEWEMDQVVKNEKERKEAEKKARAAAAAARLKQEKDAALKVQQQAEDSFKDEEQKLTEKYERELAQLQKFGLDTAVLTDAYQRDLAAIAKKHEDEERARKEKEEKERLDAEKKANDERLAAARSAADAQLDLLEKLADRRTRLSEATIDDEEKAASATYEIEQQALRDRIAALEQFRAEALELGDQETALKYQQEAADLSVEIELREAEEKQRIRKKDKKNREQAAKETVASVSSVLGAIADIYESNGKEDAKAQKRAKNLRIAAATIDMLQGAVTAYATAQTLGPIAGPIVGAINAAAVTAAGLANIAKIRATDTSGNSAPNDSYSAPAVADAPQVNPEVQVVRNLTGQSEEDRLNQPQRVYILQSDIEAAGNQSRAVVAESTF